MTELSGETALDGVILKLSRAETHLHELADAVNEFLAGDLFDPVADLDYRGRPVVRVTNVRQPPAELSVLAGECIYNLRSALDHVAYQLAVLNSGSTRLSRKVAETSAFPIKPTGPRFRDAASRSLKGISPSARSVIEQLQPYHRRRNPNARCLLALEQLSNIDKHRLLHLTAVAIGGAQLGLKGSGFLVLRGYRILRRSLRENAALLLLDGEFDLQRGLEIDLQLAPDVVFDEGGQAPSVRGQSLVGTLRSVADFVALEAMPRLVELFPGIEYEARVT